MAQSKRPIILVLLVKQGAVGVMVLINNMVQGVVSLIVVHSAGNKGRTAQVIPLPIGNSE